MARRAYGSPERFLCSRRSESVLSVRIPSRDERDMLVAMAPDLYEINDHYLNSSFVMVRLDRASPDLVAARLRAVWLIQAPKRLQKAHPEVLAGAV